MTSERCGQPTTTKAPCQNEREGCRYHGQKKDGDAPGTKPAPAEHVDGSDEGLPGHVLDALDKHELRPVTWYWLDRLTREFDLKYSSAAVSWARLIERLGPEPASRDQAAAEAALLGGIMHGMPPRDADQWALVRKLFDPQTVRDISRWRPNPFTLDEGEEPEIPGWDEE